MATSTIQLLNTMEFAKQFNFYRNFALGNFNEPAFTSANTIMQTMLGAPFRWRWNRVVTGFVSVVGQQDYTIFNWAPLAQVQIGWMLVDSNGNCQTVTTAGTTGASAPAWNATKGQTTPDGTSPTQVIWTNLGTIGTPVSQTYNFAWIENASVQATDSNSGLTKWEEISPKLGLGLSSQTDRPHSISAQGDNGSGNITFRLMPPPDQTYPVSITMQQKPPLFSKVTQTWAPIPDEYAHLYNWGFLALMFLFADDPRFQAANNKFIANLLSTQSGLTETEINIVLNNWAAITLQPVTKSNALAQGFQTRTGI